MKLKALLKMKPRNIIRLASAISNSRVIIIDVMVNERRLREDLYNYDKDKFYAEVANLSQPKVWLEDLITLMVNHTYIIKQIYLVNNLNIDDDDRKLLQAYLGMEDDKPVGDFIIPIPSDKLEFVLTSLLSFDSESISNEVAHIFNQVQKVKYIGSSIDVSCRKGCHVLYGAAGSGKSWFIRDMELAIKRTDHTNGAGLVSISMSEPEANSLDTASGMRELFIRTLLGTNDYVLVDSMRGVVFSSSGNTLSGGVSSTLVEFIATLSSLAEWTGNEILAVVNPLTNDEGKTDMLFEALAGSSTSVIFLKKREYDTGIITSRTLDTRESRLLPRSELVELMVNNSTNTKNGSILKDPALVGDALVEGIVSGLNSTDIDSPVTDINLSIPLI